MPHHPGHLLLAMLALAIPAAAHQPVRSVTDQAAAAVAWLDSLDPAQRARATFAVDDDERQNWHFVPRTRRGVPLKDMNDAQLTRARALVAAALSERGRLATDAIIALEDVLFQMEGSSRRDRGNYFFSIFGSPAPGSTWGWRLEGHHLSLNFLAVAGGGFAVTPMFFGANPAEVRIDHAQKGRRALAPEEDLGRALVKSLTPDQLHVARIAGRAPSDVITGSDRQAQLDAPTGLSYPQMTSAQQTALRLLVDVYAGRLRPELADAEVQRIADRGWETVHFAWAGGLEPGEGHYYRIHGPEFVIEYDNTQDRANHIHTTWRRFDGDFGRDLLREHHAEAHSGTDRKN